MSVRKNLPRVAVIAVVVLALLVFIWNAVQTSTARVNASTASTSTFSAGTVDIAQPGQVVDVLFDQENLFPGSDIEGCVEIEYRGSVPAEVKLYARPLGGTGLDNFINVRITLPVAATCEAVSETPRVALFNGPLSEFWRKHTSYQSGLDLRSMSTSDTAVLHVRAELADDDEAQGLVTDFSLTIEARP